MGRGLIALDLHLVSDIVAFQQEAERAIGDVPRQDARRTAYRSLAAIVERCDMGLATSPDNDYYLERRAQAVDRLASVCGLPNR